MIFSQPLCGFPSSISLQHLRGEPIAISNRIFKLFHSYLSLSMPMKAYKNAFDNDWDSQLDQEPHETARFAPGISCLQWVLP